MFNFLPYIGGGGEDESLLGRATLELKVEMSLLILKQFLQVTQYTCSSIVFGDKLVILYISGCSNVYLLFQTPATL
jgi:hypothetical protein